MNKEKEKYEKEITEKEAKIKSKDEEISKEKEKFNKEINEKEEKIKNKD